MSERLGISPQTRVLEAGCGIGGPARYLAATYGCNVVGIDLAEDFIAAAGPLNELLGLSGQVVCGVGDVTDTGFEDASFDFVWSQNVLMNVEDKPGVLREMHRLLKPGGRFGLQSQMQVGLGELDYPVPWASGPESNFLCSGDDFQMMAKDAGFRVTSWEESTSVAPRSAAPPPLGLNFGVIMKYQSFEDLVNNARASAERGILSAAVAVLTK